MMLKRILVGALFAFASGVTLAQEDTARALGAPPSVPPHGPMSAASSSNSDLLQQDRARIRADRAQLRADMQRLRADEVAANAAALDSDRRAVRESRAHLRADRQQLRADRERAGLPSVHAQRSAPGAGSD